MRKSSSELSVPMAARMVLAASVARRWSLPSPLRNMAPMRSILRILLSSSLSPAAAPASASPRTFLAVASRLMKPLFSSSSLSAVCTQKPKFQIPSESYTTNFFPLPLLYLPFTNLSIILLIIFFTGLISEFLKKYIYNL